MGCAEWKAVQKQFVGYVPVPAGTALMQLNHSLALYFGIWYLHKKWGQQQKGAVS